MVETYEEREMFDKRTPAEVWQMVEEIAAEVEKRIESGPDPVEQHIEHRLRMAKLHRLFWRVFK